MAFTYATVWLLISPDKEVVGVYGKFDRAVDDIPLPQQRVRRQIDAANWIFGTNTYGYLVTKRQIKDSSGL